MELELRGGGRRISNPRPAWAVIQDPKTEQQLSAVSWASLGLWCPRHPASSAVNIDHMVMTTGTIVGTFKGWLSKRYPRIVYCPEP